MAHALNLQCYVLLNEVGVHVIYSLLRILIVHVVDFFYSV
jgi:hypothetical protein